MIVPMSDIKYTIYPLPAALMMEHKLSDRVVNALNQYLENLLKDEKRVSHDTELVGQIHQGEQLKMEHKHKDLKEFSDLLATLGVNYIQQFVKLTGGKVNPKRVEINDLWSVHSYEGDYNPIHDHVVKTDMGISCTTWTKVPAQIGKLGEGENQSEEFTLYGASGAVDGFLSFTYGLNQIKDPERLRPSQARVIKPEVGRLMMFPSWMQHGVYPFFGEGERRTVAANLNCWDIPPEELMEIRNAQEQNKPNRKERRRNKKRNKKKG